MIGIHPIWFLIPAFLFVTFIVVKYPYPLRMPPMPKPPVLPRPPSEYRTNKSEMLLKVMKQDLEDFKAGRPSMLSKYVPLNCEDFEEKEFLSQLTDHLEVMEGIPLKETDWNEEAKTMYKEGK